MEKHNKHESRAAIGLEKQASRFGLMDDAQTEASERPPSKHLRGQLRWRPVPRYRSGHHGDKTTSFNCLNIQREVHVPSAASFPAAWLSSTCRCLLALLTQMKHNRTPHTQGANSCTISTKCTLKRSIQGHIQTFRGAATPPKHTNTYSSSGGGPQPYSSNVSYTHNITQIKDNTGTH